MHKVTENLYQAAICYFYPDAKNIRQPYVCGTVSPVFFAEMGEKTIVCKFNNLQILLRNALVGRVMKHHGIPAPQTTVHNFQKVYFESYDYCPDKTLFEQISENASDAYILSAFENILRIEHQLSQIDINEFCPNKYRYFHEILKSNVADRFNTRLVGIYSVTAYILGQYGKRYLFHNDMHSKNVLTNANGEVSRILDLDAVALSNENYCLAMLLRNYPGSAAEYDYLLDFYESLKGAKINRPAIFGTLKALQALKAFKCALTGNKFTHGK